MTFVDWINEQLNERGWSMRELARRAQISYGTLPMITSGERQPGPDFCKAIATALDIPTEMVYRQAGLLPTIEDIDKASFAELADAYKNLDKERRAMVLRLVLEVYGQQQRERADHKPQPT